MHDYGSGLNADSFRVTADFALDGVAAGENFAPEVQEHLARRVGVEAMLYAFRSDTSSQVWKLWVNRVASFSRCLVGRSAKHPSMASWNLWKS